MPFVLLLALFSTPGMLLAFALSRCEHKTRQPLARSYEHADIRAINAVLDERIEFLDSHALGQDDFTQWWIAREDEHNITIHHADALAAYQLEQEYGYTLGPELLEWLIARHMYRTGLNVQDRLETTR